MLDFASFELLLSIFYFLARFSIKVFVRHARATQAELSVPFLLGIYVPRKLIRHGNPPPFFLAESCFCPAVTALKASIFASSSAFKNSAAAASASATATATFASAAALAAAALACAGLAASRNFFDSFPARGRPI